MQGLNIGGIEHMAASLVRSLDAGEFRSSFATFDWKGKLASELEAAGYAILHRKRRGRLDLGWVAWLAREIRRRQIDIVQAHNATALQYGVAVTAVTPGTRLLYTEHDRSFPTPWRQRALHALLARRTDAVATVSETLRQQLVQWEHFPPARTRVIYNGVQLDAAARTRAQVRADLGLGDRPTAGIIARLAPVKNHALLLRAWKRVVDAVPQARLLIVGDGSQKEQLQALHAELGLGDSVSFLGFRLDITDLLQALDVFVLSSYSEGLSLTLLEAEAMRLPVVATDVGGNGEVVLHEETGLLVPSNSVEPLAGALARLLQDANERARFGTRGRAHYERHFTLPAMVRGYSQLYRDLCGRSAPQGETAPQLVTAGGQT